MHVFPIDDRLGRRTLFIAIHVDYGVRWNTTVTIDRVVIS